MEQKWYWCWYENKRAAEKNNGRNTDGFIPMASITSVHRSPERTDQFVIKYAGEKGSETLFYRREQGKGLDIWIEGIDLCFSEVRKVIKSKKAAGEQEETALKRMKQMHTKWEQSYGVPQNEEQWKKWYNWFKESNFDDELIKKLYSEINQASASKAAQSKAAQPKQKLAPAQPKAQIASPRPKQQQAIPAQPRAKKQ